MPLEIEARKLQEEQNLQDFPQKISTENTETTAYRWRTHHLCGLMILKVTNLYLQCALPVISQLAQQPIHQKADCFLETAEEMKEKEKGQDTKDTNSMFWM